MERMSLNVLLSLIMQTKIKGRGHVSNEKIYVKFISAIADGDEKDLLKKFNNEIVPKEAYRKFGRFLSRFLKDGKGYPYDLTEFTEFEGCIGDSVKYAEYLRKIGTLCNEILDENKINPLVYTLLEIIRQDSNIRVILYNSEFVEKENLLGSYAHPKRICIEALLLGLLYHVHKNPALSQNIKLFEVPDKRTFHVVHFSGYNSLNPELPINLTDNIHENSKHQRSAELKYRLDFRHNNEIISELPENRNIFLYCTGGAGKTTVLLNQIMNEHTVNFYFPLYQYKPEIRENLHIESCRILLQILLKYHYQYEYQTYEIYTANEGEETILQQLTELENMFKILPVSRPKYRLLLDGFNEIPLDLQRDFLCEL
ncbi:MAG: hypothetical protein IJ666_04255 [Ruminococcus sp.]|nr:hypothetical protein [Ruminococcus sp.]